MTKYGFTEQFKKHREITGLFNTLKALSKTDILQFLEKGTTKEELSQKYNPYLINLIIAVLKKGKIILEFDKKIFLNEKHLPKFLFFDRLDVIYSYLPQDNEISDLIVEKLTLDNDDIISPEPNWNSKRLSKIGVFAYSEEIKTLLKSLDNIKIEGSLLDLGAGHGLYSIELAKKYPDLKILASDLEKVIPLTKQNIQKYNLEDRINIFPLNFLTNHIEEKYNYILCSNILHKEKRDIVLQKVYNALYPNGKIIINTRVLNTINKNLYNAVSALYWYINKGKIETIDFWKDILVKYGFKNIKVCGFYELHAFIVAEK